MLWKQNGSSEIILFYTKGFGVLCSWTTLITDWNYCQRIMTFCYFGCGLHVQIPGLSTFLTGSKRQDFTLWLIFPFRMIAPVIFFLTLEIYKAKRKSYEKLSMYSIIGWNWNREPSLCLFWGFFPFSCKLPILLECSSVERMLLLLWFTSWHSCTFNLSKNFKMSEVILHASLKILNYLDVLSLKRFIALNFFLINCVPYSL